MSKEILILILSYLLGSFPSGYIFTKIFSKKNILEIGWKKTSGSNVFKNIGFLPGILTAIFDLGKGYLAVFFAQKLNFSIQIQALSGVFAVCGHNWSIFLKGGGGRGIGTFLGSLLFLSPKILIYSLLPALFFVFVWDTSIATIIFLFLVIFISFLEKSLTSVGLLPLFSLFPIFLKRLSPIKEISFRNFKLIRNRILFDDDKFHHDWRIKRIFERLTREKKSEK